MILITGAKGQLGSELRELCRQEGLAARGADSTEWNICDPETGANIFEESRPKFLINCAAYTAVDRAEEDPDRARSINATAVDTLGSLCQRFGTFLIQVSTDFVFGGDSVAKGPVRPYLPDDPVAPRGVYASTKAEGEKAVLDRFGPGMQGAAIVRTGWVYSVHGKNFPLAILNKARAILSDPGQGPLRVVEDQIGRPTWAGRLADFLLAYVKRLSAEESPENRSGEILHLCNSGVASWYDFACAVLDLAGDNGLLAGEPSRPVPVPSSEYRTPAPRPAYSVLDLERSRTFYDIPHWRSDLKIFMNQLRAGS